MNKPSSPHRLLSINNYFYRRGGAEVVFLEHNRLFEDVDWEIVPFAMRHPKNFRSPWEEYFVDEIEFGNAYSLPQKIGMAQKVIFSLEARKKIAALVEKARPHVAHAHNVYHHISPSIFGTLKQLGVPTVLTLHDLKLACPSYKMLAHDGICERCKGGKVWNVLTNRCVKDSTVLSAVALAETVVNRALGSYTRNVDRFVVPSKFLLEKLVDWGFPRERFVHVPNFVNAAELVPKGEPGKVFTFVGRLNPEKGLSTFVRAVALAGVQARIVGTGPEEENLKRLAQSLGADVEFAGYRTGEALFDAIRDSRATVLPSELYENAPMSVMEAYSLERPVIGADIGGIPELMRRGETGELFQAGNAEDLAKILRNYADKSPEQIAAMGRAGRDWMVKDFTDIRYRERMLDLYKGMGIR